MNEFYIESANSIVKIITTNDNINKIKQNSFLISYIPSVKILDKSDYYDAQIEIYKSNINDIILDFPKVKFYYKNFNTKDIISLTEYILERLRQEKGIICIHGAGAIINNSLIVCWGTATGMGKSTLALKLSENNNFFYSDEKILIDLNNFKAIGRIKNQYLSNNYWKSLRNKKQYYTPLNLAKDIPYNISMFVHPIISNSDNYILDIWEPKKFLWHLYEESSRKIRGTSRMFFNNTYPIMSLDTELLSKKRLKLINKFTKNIKSIYYNGNCENALYVINEILKNKGF